MKIAFVAVNYNNALITINYVNNIIRLKDISEYKIVIVDNNSNKEDYDELKKALEGLPNVILKRSLKNLGYFGGLNSGIKEIDYRDYQYVIVGNNDMIFEYEFYEKLKTKKYDINDLVVVPDLRTMDGIHQNPQYINRPSNFRKLCYRIYYSSYILAIAIDGIYNFKRKLDRRKKKLKIENQCEIFLCTGACMILNKEFFEKCGLLDDTFFLWGEEAALIHQVESAGGKILYDPSLLVLHFENASVRKIQSRRKYELFKKSYSIYKDYI